MTSFRRRLPRWAAAWFVFQVASLATLLATDCCVTHQAVSTDQHGCHNTAPAVHCPMRSAAGSPCPMHRVGAQNSASTEASCALRGTCSQPLAALAALLWIQAVLTDQLDILPDEGTSIVRSRMHDPLVSRPDAPDSPPPRA